MTTVWALDASLEPKWNDYVSRHPHATLFHELVHVEQVRQLGTRAFVERYLRGWLEAGRSYGAIPLERDAYALERRFRSAPAEPFDVAAEVARRLESSR